MMKNTEHNPFSLEGETALITGGGSGIGAAIAGCMHAAGANVILVGRDEEHLARTAESLGRGAGWLQHDITDFDAAGALVERALSCYGDITCLVNNAGNHIKKDAVATSVDEMRRIMDTHIFGAHSLSRALAPRMMERRRGSILFIASMASIFGIPGVVAYSAAKSAMIGVVRTLAAEFSPFGVRVNAIAPGWIETEMSRKSMEGDPARRDKVLGRTPMGCFGTPDDIGRAAVFLASEAASFVTGVLLPVDGGVSIGF